MKKTTKTIGMITAMGIMLVCAYMLGATRAETVIETQKVIETVEVIPDGYIALNKCIPLEDVACWFMNEYDYPCLELKDVATQYNADNTRSYADIMSELPNETKNQMEHLVDMRTVVDFVAGDYGLQLYFNDGTGYYWEKDIDVSIDAIMETESDAYIPLDDNLVDMNTIVDFTASEYGLQLYFADGSGYLLER